jgi:Inorganic pyrophosphatase
LCDRRRSRSSGCGIKPWAGHWYRGTTARPQSPVSGGRCAGSARSRLQDLGDLPEFHRLEIEHFFLIYKELEPGKSVEGASWAGRADAEAEVEASRRRLRDQPRPEL